MTEFQRLTQSSLAEHIATVGGVSFTLRGLSYIGTRNDLTEDERLQIGEVIRDAAATLLFPFVEFHPPLRVGEKVTFLKQFGVKPETLRIGHVAQDQLSITLTLQDKEK